jgi:hypothetical protein
VPFEYEQHTISYSIPVRGGKCAVCDSTHVGKRSTYTPDFRLPGAIFVESKGYFTARDRTKLAAIRSQHPEIDLRILFAVDNWTTKLHKQRYSEWASKHGFLWAVGKVVPEAWVTSFGGKLDAA